VAAVENSAYASAGADTTWHLCAHGYRARICGPRPVGQLSLGCHEPRRDQRRIGPHGPPESPPSMAEPRLFLVDRRMPNGTSGGVGGGGHSPPTRFPQGEKEVSIRLVIQMEHARKKIALVVLS